MTTTTATEEQLTQIRRAAVNDVTRAIARDGIRLTWAQADDVGDQALDWMVARLGLERETDIEGVTFAPTSTTETECENCGKVRACTYTDTANYCAECLEQLNAERAAEDKARTDEDEARAFLHASSTASSSGRPRGPKPGYRVHDGTTAWQECDTCGLRIGEGLATKWDAAYHAGDPAVCPRCADRGDDGMMCLPVA